MKDWEKFEIQASKYLSSIINHYDFKVIKTGGSDSTANDIIVLHKGNPSFSVDAKLSPSQCGQFVLLESNDSEFVLSDKMIYENKFTFDIVNKIEYNNLKSSSLVKLEIEQSLLIDWIKFHYLNKGVKYLITSTGLNSFHAIIPIKDIGSYFEFSCVLRKKRSGTRGVPKRDRENVLNLLNEHLKNISLENLSIINEDSGIYILKPPTKRSLSRNDLYFDNYFISESNPKMYEVKVRASTNNPNVVFSLKYKGPNVDFGKKEFLDYIKTISI
jgi:hypothetical protein